MTIGRKQVATLVAEFLGVGVLTLTFLSVQRSTIGIPYFVAIAAGAAVAVAAYFIGDISGAHLNPAVTLALWTARKVGTVLAATYIIVQCLGAWAAYGVYHYFVNNTVQSIGGHYSARVLLAEAIGTFVLALAWGAVAFRKNESASHRGILLGGGYALAIIIASVAGAGIANPAVAIGVRAWAFAGSMGWGTYLLGPVLGAIIGINLYGVLFGDYKDTALGKLVAVDATEVSAVGVSTKSTRSTASSRGKRSASSSKKKTGSRR
jgi:glycerol uptake facilitator protein